MLHEIGGEAFGFMQEECSSGGILGQALITLPPGGQVFAILPTETSPTDLIDFGSGVVAAGNEPGELADLIQDHVSGRPDHICVFEDPTARVGDARGPDTNFFTVTDRVYPFVSSQARHEEIVNAARATHWYPSIGVISAVGPGQELPASGSSQSKRLLVSLAERASVILIGAYDGESWLVWYPGSHRASA